MNEHKGGPYDRAMARELFDANFFGHVFLTRALEPLLRKAADGCARIVNVSSSLGSVGERVDASHPFYGVPGDFYRASKAALNMQTASQNFAYQGWAKAWAFCPGYVVTNLSGEETRQMRKDHGADSSETSAQGILDIVSGKRDGETDKFVARNGETHIW